MRPIRWHSQTVSQCMEQLETSLQGLSHQEAENRLNRYGKNLIDVERKPRFWKKWINQFHNLLIYILVIAAAITGLLQHWIDMSVILAVIVLNAIIGYLQEAKAEKAMQALQQLLSQRTTVIRSHKRRQIETQQLVPGDIVLLQAGNKVPADLRLIKTHHLQVNESLLTGESLPVTKSTEPVEKNALLVGRQSMAYSGTFVTYGAGSGVVVATGKQTEVGKISTLLTHAKPFTTPLLQQIAIFSRWLAMGILIIAYLAFLFGILVQHYPMEEMFMAAVAIAVAIIPEGLPAMITVILAIGVAHMGRHHTVIRQLAAVEILSAVTVICTDKTGTLTKNELTVKEIVTDGNQFSVTGSGYNDQGEIQQQGQQITVQENTALSTLLCAGLLCNDAELNQTNDTWQLIGHPVDGALLALNLKAQQSLSTKTNSYPRIAFIPFDSQHKLMASLHQTPENTYQLFVKGAPEKILDLSHYQASNTGNIPIDRAFWQCQIEKLAQHGMKVLACAYQKVTHETEKLSLSDLPHTLTFLGIIGMIDAPREEAADAIHTCQQAGITVKMITGDHPLTAKSVAGQIGIPTTPILNGQEIDKLTNDELNAILPSTHLFTRTVPEHKLRLIKALKKGHHVVAMTGDGVNDAPALKHADIGIAMGIKGAEVAKEASRMVLADDNFSSIIKAIEEARSVYNKLKKTILFVLPTNGGQGFTLFFAIIFGYTLPITPLQILWVNMVTSITLGLAFAFESKQKDLMRHPPRRANEPLLSKLLLWRISFVSLLFVAALFSFFIYSRQHGLSINLSRTLVVNLMVLLEAVYLINCRYIYSSILTKAAIKNSLPIWIAITIVITLQLGFTYLPFMQALFDSEAIKPIQWLIIVTIAATTFFIIECEKTMIRQLRGKHSRKVR